MFCDKYGSNVGEGQKVVKVEVRKKRTMRASSSVSENKMEIDQATANKLKLIAEAKEFEEKRKIEEEEKEAIRQKQKEEDEKIQKEKVLQEKTIEETKPSIKEKEEAKKEVPSVKNLDEKNNYRKDKKNGSRAC